MVAPRLELRSTASAIDAHATPPARRCKPGGTLRPSDPAGPRRTLERRASGRTKPASADRRPMSSCTDSARTSPRSSRSPSGPAARGAHGLPSRPGRADAMRLLLVAVSYWSMRHPPPRIRKHRGSRRPEPLGRLRAATRAETEACHRETEETALARPSPPPATRSRRRARTTTLGGTGPTSCRAVECARTGSSSCCDAAIAVALSCRHLAAARARSRPHRRPGGPS